MDFDALLLSRIQFGFTIAFHILFPALTIGLAGFLAVLEALWLRTDDEHYRQVWRFWIKIFALSFGLGVVSGIVLSYQIGTNWSGYARATGNVLGPLLAYEVLTAFFLEAGFLGIMLFGWERVGNRLHFAATCCVAVGTMISAFWILSANSWMQTPAGHRLEDGVFYVTSWWEVIFNPSFPYRLAHMLTAAYLASAFAIAGVAAWYLLRREHLAFARTSFSFALGLAALLAPLQVLLGDLHGLNTLEHQPVKVAAMEGSWQRERGAPFVLFAWPDEAAERNRYAIEIPYASSLILTHSLDGEVPGLTDVPAAERPNVPIVFFSFRVMVGLGFLMLFAALAGLWLRWRGRLYETRWFLWLCAALTPAGFVAILAGWLVTEVGRQPYTVYGLLRTADSLAPVAAGAVATSLALFVVIYNLLLAAFLWFGWKLVRQGPAVGERPSTVTGSRRPLSMPAEAD